MQGTITVVTGLPRSGTSLAMQMLAAGGVEPFSDGERVADEDNPRGYLELEAVKRLKQSADWVPQARGKAVKVISHLLGDLPAGETYRVLFIERDLDEVLASQAKMIARRGQPAPPEAIVRRAFESHLAASAALEASRSDMSFLRLSYAAIIAESRFAAKQIATHVGDAGGGQMDIDAMVAAVDPSLYRNRHSGQ
ncbi:MAG: sulfotransferase family protein [Planctomycetota bacterium]